MSNEWLKQNDNTSSKQFDALLGLIRDTLSRYSEEKPTDDEVISMGLRLQQNQIITWDGKNWLYNPQENSLTQDDTNADSF